MTAGWGRASWESLSGQYRLMVGDTLLGFISRALVLLCLLGQSALNQPGHGPSQSGEPRSGCDPNREQPNTDCPLRPRSHRKPSYTQNLTPTFR